MSMWEIERKVGQKITKGKNNPEDILYLTTREACDHWKQLLTKQLDKAHIEIEQLR